MIGKVQSHSDAPSFLCSVKSKGPGHRYCSVWLLCQRYARTVPAERRCGEDLHEDECERLVERRSKRQGERPSQCDHHVNGGGWAATGIHDGGVPLHHLTVLPPSPAPHGWWSLLKSGTPEKCIVWLGYWHKVYLGKFDGFLLGKGFKSMSVLLSL